MSAIDDAETAAAGADSGPRAREHVFELMVVVLMSLTAVLTAWTGYQTAKWSGVATASYSRASALRIEATRLSSSADRQRQTDVALVIALIEAIADEDHERIDFLHDRLPTRLQVAVDAWEATDPRNDASAPKTPFDMPEYTISAEVEAAALLEEADEATAEAHRASDRIDRYVVMTVLFAVVLFFAAMSSKLPSRRGRTLILELAALGFAVGAIILLLLPKRV